MQIDEVELLKNKIAEQISPLKIYLFGSFAEGKQTEDSDYDFLQMSIEKWVIF